LLAAHCGPEPGEERTCSSMPGEVAEGSDWFDEADVRAAEWSTSGKWIYAERYGYPDTPTTFTLDIRWSGEPYQATLHDCEDGTRRTGGVTVPVTVELVTSDGAFDDVFQAQTIAPSSARATYTFERLPADQRRGSFVLPASASSDYVACDSPELVGGRIGFDAERRSGAALDLHDPGYSWLHWICTTNAYPIGRPEFDRVARPAQ
jgi:hypothetical protein